MKNPYLDFVGEINIVVAKGTKECSKELTGKCVGKTHTKHINAGLFSAFCYLSFTRSLVKSCLKD